MSIDADAFLEVLSTTRSIRRYSRQAIPPEDLCKILYAASRAATPANRQGARYLVLSHTGAGLDARRLLAGAYRERWQLKASEEGWWEGSGERSDSRKHRAGRAMQQFVDDFETTPLVILGCTLMRFDPPPKYPRTLDPQYEGSAIYPGCQNLLLAARALGYGGTLSGWHSTVDRELRSILNIPDDVSISTVVTIGRPVGGHGPLRRRPLAAVVYEDEWQQSAPWAVDPPGSRFVGAEESRPDGTERP